VRNIGTLQRLNRQNRKWCAFLPTPLAATPSSLRSHLLHLSAEKCDWRGAKWQALITYGRSTRSTEDGLKIDVSKLTSRAGSASARTSSRII
jgi:hypothetical protein